VTDAAQPSWRVPALREEQVPARLADAVVRGPQIDAARDAILLRVPDVGRFLVRSDGPVLVERADGASDADLRCFRDEAVAALAALLARRLVLRAASVAIGAHVVALCGPSGAGKSALAAALAQRGHPVLSDSVTVLSPGPDGGAPTVAPVAPEPVLWPDAVEALGLKPGAGRHVRPPLPKRAYRLGPDNRPASPALAAVVILQPTPASSGVSLEAVSGGAKLRYLLGARWHQRLAHPLGQARRQFDVATRIAAVMCLSRPSRGVAVAELARQIEERMT
jgi:hypothetical protein